MSAAPAPVPADDPADDPAPGPVPGAGWPGLSADVSTLPDPGAYAVYGWGWAPHGLATRRQLASIGLTPGRQYPRGEIRWKWNRRKRTFTRFAVLYSITDARPKRPATPRQLAALALAMTARRTCPDCGIEADYCIPTSQGRCVPCQYDDDTAAYPRAA